MQRIGKAREKQRFTTIPCFWNRIDYGRINLKEIMIVFETKITLSRSFHRWTE